MRIHLHINSQGLLRLLDEVLKKLLEKDCEIIVFVPHNFNASEKRFGELGPTFLTELGEKKSSNAKISIEEYSVEFTNELDELRNIYLSSKRIYRAGELFFSQKALKSFAKPWQRYRAKFRGYLPPFMETSIEIKSRIWPAITKKNLQEINSMNFASSEYVQRLLSENPDVVLVAPVVSEPLSKIIADSCKHAEIPSVGVIASWDNLTIKGPLLCNHSRYFVWGRGQIREATDFHQFEQSRFIALGPYPFQHLAKAKALNARLAKNSEKLVWLMSSNFIVSSRSGYNPEVAAIEEFLVQAHCRKRYDLIEKLHIRIHPQIKLNPEELFLHLSQYDTDFETRFSSIQISKSQNLLSEERLSYAKLLDSSKVCIGFATTAVFESAFLGKRILVPPVDIAKAAIEDFFHGRRLLSSNGGPAIMVKNWGDFFQQIDEVQRTELQQDFTDFFGLEISPEQACNNFVTELKSLILDKEIK